MSKNEHLLAHDPWPIPVAGQLNVTLNDEEFTHLDVNVE